MQLNPIRIIKNIKTWILLHMRFLEESIFLYARLVRHNASLGTLKSREKLEFTILRASHVIEKGMSLRTPRIGFGQAKVAALIDLIETYINKYSNTEFAKYPVCVVGKYLLLLNSQGVTNTAVQRTFTRVCDTYSLGTEQLSVVAGVKQVTREEILSSLAKDFESIASGRHSIRIFDSLPPSKSQIESALSIAQTTPSACNRQAWKSYVFTGERLRRLLSWQDGAHGFEEEIPCAILVTSNLSGFFSHEPFQAYVDGGMYAMNLLLALHSKGFGTIPLSTGFERRKIERLSSEFCIPNSEVPIIIIGFGNLCETFHIAASHRKPIALTSNYSNSSII